MAEVSRVLLVHNRYRSTSPGGEDRVVDQEAAALAAAGVAVDRFERFSDDIAGWPAVQKALVPGRVLWSDEVRRSLADTLRRSRPDVVHVHNTFPLLSPSVLYACRSAGVPVVATIHHYGLVCASGVLFRDGDVCHQCVGRSPLPGVLHGCYRGSRAATTPMAAALLVHRRAWRTMISAYVFISGSQRDIMATDGFPEDRLFVKHNFVPTAPPGERSDGELVLYAGRLTAAKGVDLLIAAWDQFRALAPDSRLRLVIAGAGPLEPDVAAWAATRPSVDFLGMLGRDECAALMATARASIVPSRWEETFGLVVAESMAAGVPPIAAAHGSLPELIDSGRDGVLFPPGDASALAGILVEVAGDRCRFLELGGRARSTYERRFRQDHNIEQLLEIYRFAIDRPVG